MQTDVCSFYLGLRAEWVFSSVQFTVMSSVRLCNIAFPQACIVVNKKTMRCVHIYAVTLATNRVPYPQLGYGTAQNAD